uniref:Palmitoyltransferase n=2 Tax=Caenorhabditis tropicalis TaxID=1561998 RepID=A0A1I7T4K3_9PELO
MSWYSKIYVAVREYRAKHTYLGWIATRCLNILLLTQLFFLWLTLYFYITVTIGYYVQSSVQATIYLIVFSFLFVMSMWSLAKTLFTRIGRVPERYRPSKELEDRLKAVTPFENNRYVVEKSTAEQLKQQNIILEEMCIYCKVVVAECDQVGRLKYCYECGHIKPDRARHCSSCGKCCIKYDHHCPWINMCVTHANYKYFLLYIIYTSLLVYWYLLTSLEGVVRYFIIQKWTEDLWKILYYVFSYIAGGIFGYYPLGELIIFHYQLISLNETTVEQTKPAVLRFDNAADYNMGKPNNFRAVFGWGLWMCPIESNDQDGLHFDIRYVNTKQCNRFVRIEEEPSSSAPSAESSSQ